MGGDWKAVGTEPIGNNCRLKMASDSQDNIHVIAQNSSGELVYYTFKILTD
jgi:hypothetical protein